MELLLVVGGAYAGKRGVVRNRIDHPVWLSAYHGDHLEDWSSRWESGTDLVMEGWEKWIRKELEQGYTKEHIRNLIKHHLAQMTVEEVNRQQQVVLIMLEMGRGIVPLAALDREIRDIAGWVLQDAANIAEEVLYVWHGLHKPLKGVLGK